MTIIHVVAAAIFDSQNRVLVAQRPAHVHQGGLWEFPGGKLEPGESAEQALRRELQEELGIDVVRARPLIQIRHDYPDKSVLLDVWRVDEFAGQPHGREGQPIEWVGPEWLPLREFPAANNAIVAAVRLPSQCLITPEPHHRDQFLRDLDESLTDGISLVQLRAASLSAEMYKSLAWECLQLTSQHGASLILNGPAELALEIGADGVHLNSFRFWEATRRPLPNSMWVSAAAHNADDVRRASELGLDFVLLSPVLATPTHPDAVPLGWDVFAEIVQSARLPVYALGGVGSAHTAVAQSLGGQGVAGVRQFWSGQA